MNDFKIKFPETGDLFSTDNTARQNALDWLHNNLPTIKKADDHLKHFSHLTKWTQAEIKLILLGKVYVELMNEMMTLARTHARPIVVLTPPPIPKQPRSSLEPQVEEIPATGFMDYARLCFVVKCGCRHSFDVPDSRATTGTIVVTCTECQQSHTIQRGELKS